MKKELLISFIEKYNLGGLIQKVTWKVMSNEKILRTRGELDSKTFIADVQLKEFTDISEDIRIPIADTDKVKSMLSPFGDEFVITLNKDGDRIKGFSVSNNDCESYCTAAEPLAIPPVTKNIDDKHEYDVEIPLTSEFIQMFLRSKNALKEVEEFTIKMNAKGKVEFVIGYSAANTNRINILAPTQNGKDKFDGQPIKFPLKNIVKVLESNKEIENGVAYLKSNGVFKITYSDKQFECLYYQFASIKK